MGVGVGTGVGVGVASVPAIDGAVRIWATDSASSVTFCPPVKADINGVISRKWPTTLTVTVLPRPSAQLDGLQVRLTSAWLMVTNPPAASLTTRHMTLLVVWLHGAPAWYAFGSSANVAATRAPSRAALSMVIRA